MKVGVRIICIVIIAVITAFGPFELFTSIPLKNGLALAGAGFAMIAVSLGFPRGTVLFSVLMRHPLAQGVAILALVSGVCAVLQGASAWYAVLDVHAPATLFALSAIALYIALLSRTHGSRPFIRAISFATILAGVLDLSNRHLYPFLGGVTSVTGLDGGAWYFGIAFTVLLCASALRLEGSYTSRVVVYVGTMVSGYLLASGVPTAPVVIASIAIGILGFSEWGRRLADTTESVRRRTTWITLLVAGVVLIWVVRMVPLHAPLQTLEHPGLAASSRVAFSFLAEADMFSRITGAGTFQYWWSYAKPDTIDGISMALADFAHGTGLFPYVVSVGLLGGVAMLVLLAQFFVRCLRSLIDAETLDPERAVFASAGIYGALAMIFGPIDPAIAIVLSIAIGVSIGQGVVWLEPVRSKVNPWARHGTAIFLGLLGSTILGIACVHMFVRIEYDLGVVTFERDQDIVRAQYHLDRAIRRFAYPPAHRARSQMDQFEAGGLVFRDSAATQGELVFNIMDHAVARAGMAVTNEPRDYYSALVLGNAHAQLAGLGIEGGKERARKSYLRASALSPKNPTAHFLLARMYVESGDIDTARIENERALRLLPTFEPALELKQRLEQQ